MRKRYTILALTLAVFMVQAPSLASEPPASFSEGAFDAAQRAGGIVVIETWGPWCLPCKIQAPIIERLRKIGEFRSMRVLRVGEETPLHVWQRFRLSGYGMIVVFRDGKEVARGTPTSEKALLSLLRTVS